VFRHASALEVIVLKEQEGKLLTVNQVAEYLHVSKTTIYRWIKDGTLHSVGVGRKHLFKEKDIAALLGEEKR